MILGIESSCDETAVALLDLTGNVQAHLIASQTAIHEKWGGVVPNLAARAHADNLAPLVQQVLDKASTNLNDLTAIAATAGPGLIAGLRIGTLFAKTLSFVLKKPYIAINHLEGHALLPCLTNNVQFPYLLLLISGGHTQFFLVQDLGSYILLGESLDDALGEAFDKTARLLGLGYPGGADLEKLASQGNPSTFHFTPPLKGRPGCDFSFSGLKTAVRETIQKHAPLSEETKANLAASFQKTISFVLKDRLKHAVRFAKDKIPTIKTLVISGGVAANRYLFQELSNTSKAYDLKVVTPPPELCTDNGIMIAYAGLKRYQAGFSSPLSTDVQARWPLHQATLH